MSSGVATADGTVEVAPGMRVSKAEERRVILASALGTVFEWYDFFIYATLAPFFAALFFPPGNDTAALLSAFATYAAGFLVRPFGAIVFGRVGDLVGRKYTFLVTILIMGLATFLTGLLPTFGTIGWAAPLLLVSLRLLQGLAIGGEYGGAATYVAEHAPHNGRGYATSWIQTTGTLGLLLSLIVILACREGMDATVFKNWGWRIPFIGSLILLAFSLYIRLKLNESPVFQRMKEEGTRSEAPLTESFLRMPNARYVFLALFGACCGQGVIWYTGQFYALFFLTISLHLDYVSAYTLIGATLIVAIPLYLFCGWLSDRIGRLKLMMASCIIAALTYFPLFHTLTRAINPDLAAFSEHTKITVAAENCNLHIFVGPWTQFTPCDRTQDFLTKAGVSFTSLPPVAGKPVVTTVGDTTVDGFDAKGLTAALAKAGYKAAPDPAKINYPLAFLVITIMVAYVALVYAPIAAFLVEMFPARIRYTSMSFPYHIGNGWAGGLLPLIATALVAWEGNIYAGLWYPVAIALVTAIVGSLFLRDNRHVDIHA